ncbi:MAG: FHA domain-containing protein [Alphaproteobacteria bacterium]|nr:FHA domain-containing protein [Alphaproteobacteria bacterium]
MSALWLVLRLRSPRGPDRLLAAPLPLTLGRAADCTLTLDDAKVSSHHARIALRGDDLEVEDLGSANGTWLGGVRHERGPWSPGEPLRVGDSQLILLRQVVQSSRVIRRSGPRGPRSEVLRLPCGAALDAQGELELSPQARGAVLIAEATGLCLLELQDGEVVERQDNEQGQLEVAGELLESRGAREFASLPTDLSFGLDGELHLARSVASPADSFPPPCFAQPVVPMSAIERTGLPRVEVDFLALGGGLGSFCWVDGLRVHGVAASRVRVVGFEAHPYARYARLCRNSQIPDHERLRSNSESCPDNYWGFPGYGAREAWSELKRGRLLRASALLWALFAEPDHAATYTPRAGDVFRSIDAEAQRIGWADMLDHGRVRAIRKTDDGRYVVAVSSRREPGHPQALYLAPALHVALGYPGVRFLPDLRAYREHSGDFERVVNAYEDHSLIYDRLSKRGTVVLRGRGIVASRVLQRLHELRQAGSMVEVIHLMRRPNTEGTRFGPARRRVEHHWEFQPFNWPEACWGGDLKRTLALADAERRQELLTTWGGTTTADRPDWRGIVRQGLRQGWYQIRIASVQDIEGDGEGLLLSLKDEEGTSKLRCDGIIDATGLVSGSQADPVLADLIETHELPLNAEGRLEVDPSFELRRLRNGAGRVFAAGVCTLGSHYAPVDSFLGLQFAATASLDALPQVPRLSPARSVSAWRRWARGAPP